MTKEKALEIRNKEYIKEILHELWKRNDEIEKLKLPRNQFPKTISLILIMLGIVIGIIIGNIR